MKGEITKALFSTFGIAWNELYYEESELRAYMQFSVNSALYVASAIKSGSQVTIYKLEKAVNVNEY